MGGGTSDPPVLHSNVASARHLDLGSPWLRTRYHSLQLGVNRPFKQGLHVEGGYTLSRSMNEAEKMAVRVRSHTTPLELRSQLGAGRERPAHNLQMGFVYQLPVAERGHS